MENYFVLHYAENAYIAFIASSIIGVCINRSESFNISYIEPFYNVLEKIKTPADKLSLAMGYRLIWNFSLETSDFPDGELWLHRSLEIYHSLGDRSAMAEMCNEVHGGGTVPPEQALKMKDYIQSFMATGSTERPD